MLDLVKGIKKYVPIMKNAAINKLDILNENYTQRSVLNIKGGLQNTVISPKHSNEGIIRIGSARNWNFNIVRVDMRTGELIEVFYYKKSDKIQIQLTQYGYIYEKHDITIPKYNYHEQEEQFFQMSCTDDKYYLKRFFMELQIAFSSNYYMNVRMSDFSDIFKENIDE